MAEIGEGKFKGRSAASETITITIRPRQFLQLMDRGLIEEDRRVRRIFSR